MYYADELFNEYVEIMLHIVQGEAGDYYYTDKDRYYLMKVIENRIKRSLFPDTIYEVIFQPRQYQPTWDGSWNKKISSSTKKVVFKYLRGKVRIDMPDNVVYQAMFIQGDFVWDVVSNGIDGPYYYCGINEEK